MFADKKFFYATSVLIGMAVGAGVFGIPFAFAKAGFWIGLLFLLVIGSATLFLNLMLGEITLRTKGDHQLVGYVNKYLGTHFKKLAFFAMTLGSYGALLAYIIISGEFLANLLSSVFYLSIDAFSIWFFVILSLLILFGIRTVAVIDFFLVSFFIILVFIITGFGFNNIVLSNFNYINSNFWFLPYGVMLFAFAGLPTIPIQRQILIGREKSLKKAIFSATFITAILYIIFGATVVGLSGDATSPDAISGLVGILGSKIVFLGSLFGVMAISTSYLTLGSALVETFHLDYKINRKLSWLLAMAPAFVLFLGGVKTFIDVVSLIGAVSVGLIMIVIIHAYKKAKMQSDRKPEYSVNLPNWLLHLMTIVFIVGIFYALVF